MTQDRDNDINLDAIAAIREAVEERQRSLGALDDGILELDDIVWRSPARPIIDPTDTIARLAEEADKVAKGIEDAPPEAIVHRKRVEPDFETRPSTQGRKPIVDDAETSIQALVVATLKEAGKIGPDGKLAISEAELRLLVRGQIDKWVAEHLTAPDQGGLRNDSEMRKNAIRNRFNEQD